MDLGKAAKPFMVLESCLQSECTQPLPSCSMVGAKATLAYLISAKLASSAAKASDGVWEFMSSAPWTLAEGLLGNPNLGLKTGTRSEMRSIRVILSTAVNI